MQDCVEQNNLKLTQEYISGMLGVGRSSVTQTAQKLQENGLIRYHRGDAEIFDLQGLEAHACECFETIKQEYDRLLGQKHEPFPRDSIASPHRPKNIVQTVPGSKLLQTRPGKWVKSHSSHQLLGSLNPMSKCDQSWNIIYSDEAATIK